jgi:hypothetical protein
MSDILECQKCGDAVDYFGAAKWEKHQDRHVRKPDWIKLSLGFFEDDVVSEMPDTQRLAFVAVLVLCGKRGNRVRFDGTYIRKQCNLRTTPDLALFMAQGLIEHVCCKPEAGVLLDEKRGDEKRGDESTEGAAAPVLLSERTPSPPSKPKSPRGENGTPTQRAAVDRCSAALGRSLGYSKANIDAVVKAEKHYSGDQVVAVLASIRDGSTPSGKWCHDRLDSGLPLDYMIRPGAKGAADRILEQLDRGDVPRDGPKVTEQGQAREDASKAGVMGGLIGRQRMGGGLAGSGGVLQRPRLEPGREAAPRHELPRGIEPPDR